MKHIQRAMDGIPFFFLKALSYINDPLVRQKRDFADIDILIARKDLEKSILALKGVGFQMISVNHSIRYNIKYGYHIVLKSQNEHRCVEAHWGLTRQNSPFLVNTTAMMRRGIKRTIAGFEFNSFCDEDIFIHAILQAMCEDYLHKGLLYKNIFLLNYVLSKPLRFQLVFELLKKYRMETLYLCLKQFLEGSGNNEIARRMPLIKPKTLSYSQIFLFSLISRGRLNWLTSYQFRIALFDLWLSPLKNKLAVLKRFFTQ